MMRMLCGIWLAMALALCGSGVSGQTVTLTPETGVTPNVLVLYRADTAPGRGSDYSSKEAEIAENYNAKKIPVYWLAMSSLTGAPNVLYFDGFDSFDDVERTGEVLGKVLATHSDIVGLQQELQSYLSGSDTVLAFRRDDLGYRMNEVELAKAKYVRVTQIELKTGTDADFADAVKAVRHFYETNDVDQPWVTYQVDSGMALPAYFEFQPMASLKEMDDAYDRQKNLQGPERAFLRQKLVQTLQASLAMVDVEIYQVSPGMSHLAPESGGKESSKARPRIEQGKQASRPAS
jgi:hypothetical protein